MLAAAAETGSEHPLGEAIAAAATDRGLTVPSVQRFEAIPGHGVEAAIGGRVVRVGNGAFMAAAGIDIEPLAAAGRARAAAGQTPMYVAAGQRTIGIVTVADQVKPGAAETVAQLKALGLEVWMLTGDNTATARAVAGAVGIDHVIAEVLPSGKAERIAALQADGHVVAMVGDGINDAPALARADLGVAIGTGTDVAIAASDITLVGGDLHGIVSAIALSRRTVTTIKQGLGWAFGYNILLIPVAAGALYLAGGPLLDPVLAAAAMAMSSVSVVTNAQRLRRFGARQRPRDPAPAAGRPRPPVRLPGHRRGPRARARRGPDRAEPDRHRPPRHERRAGLDPVRRHAHAAADEHHDDHRHPAGRRRRRARARAPRRTTRRHARAARPGHGDPHRRADRRTSHRPRAQPPGMDAPHRHPRRPRHVRPRPPRADRPAGTARGDPGVPHRRALRHQHRVPPRRRDGRHSRPAGHHHPGHPAGRRAAGAQPAQPDRRRRPRRAARRRQGRPGQRPDPDRSRRRHRPAAGQPAALPGRRRPRHHHPCRCPHLRPPARRRRRQPGPAGIRPARPAVRPAADLPVPLRQSRPVPAVGPVPERPAAASSPPHSRSAPASRPSGTGDHDYDRP